MAADTLDGIDKARSRRPSDRTAAHAWRRIYFALLSLLILLALVNTFGQRTTTSAASSDSATLQVIAPSAARGGVLYQVSVQVTAKRDLQSPTLAFSPGWFSGITTNAEVPQPSPQQSRGGQSLFALGEMKAGDTRTLHLYFQVNPTTIAWHRSQDVELDDGSSRLAVIHRTINLYP
jgi:hypothetical protein